MPSLAIALISISTLIYFVIILLLTDVLLIYVSSN